MILRQFLLTLLACAALLLPAACDSSNDIGDPGIDCANHPECVWVEAYTQRRNAGAGVLAQHAGRGF